MRKKFKTKKKMIPYLCEVLNRSRFDGEPICYSVEIGEKEATISFEQEIPGNLYHQKVVEIIKDLQEKEGNRRKKTDIWERYFKGTVSAKRLYEELVSGKR